MADRHRHKGKPLIGIAPCYKPKDNAYWLMAKESYSQSVWNANGIPVILTYPNSNGSVDESVSSVDGVILIGGPDLPIDYTNGEPYDTNGEPFMHDNRVNFDRHVVESCKVQNKPFLAICAGIQHLNVIYGGTLYEDIPTQLPGAISHGEYRGKVSYHPVDVQSNSLLHTVLGEQNTSVSSTHHQGIRELGNGLKPTAWSKDGLVEAVEPANGKMNFIAVQWHPELMQDDPRQMNLFRWLVEESASN